MTRWHAFNIMAAMPYCDLKKAGIYSPSDLIAFPWDKDGEPQDLPSDEEVDRMREELLEANRKATEVKSEE